MTSTKGGPGRPRDPDLTPRVLAAALDEYALVGRSAFTLDAVARRAQVGKAALYRRWPTKEQLLAEAIEAATRPLAAPETGSLRGDVRALSTALLAHFLDPAGWATLRIIVDAAVDPGAFGRFYEQIVENHRAEVLGLVQRAVDRGELPEDFDGKTFAEALYGAVVMRALSMNGDERQEAAGRLTEQVDPIVGFLLASIHARPGTPLRAE